MRQSGPEIRLRRIETRGAHKPKSSQIDRNEEVGGHGKEGEKEMEKFDMKVETHKPIWQDQNEIAAFVRHTSRRSGPADQTHTIVSSPHTHPELGPVVTITIDATKTGNKSNTVILHLPIKTLAQWVLKYLPDTPKVGVAPDDVPPIDFGNLGDCISDTGQ
jgi:hypothetical protein